MATIAVLLAKRIKSEDKSGRYDGVPIPVIQAVLEDAAQQAGAIHSENEFGPFLNSLDEECDVCDACSAIIEVGEAVLGEECTFCKMCAAEYDQASAQAISNESE